MSGQGTVTIRDKQWSVSLATTLSELEQGLGGLVGMPAQSGMLFDMGAPQIVQVTTVPMLFALDIALNRAGSSCNTLGRVLQEAYHWGMGCRRDDSSPQCS